MNVWIVNIIGKLRIISRPWWLPIVLTKHSCYSVFPLKTHFVQIFWTPLLIVNDETIGRSFWQIFIQKKSSGSFIKYSWKLLFPWSGWEAKYIKEIRRERAKVNDYNNGQYLSPEPMILVAILNSLDLALVAILGFLTY